MGRSEPPSRQPSCAARITSAALKASAFGGSGWGGSYGGGYGGGAAHAIVSSGELEALWPRHAFSPAVNAAKRALINRLGTDLALVCG